MLLLVTLTFDGNSPCTVHICGEYKSPLMSNIIYSHEKQGDKEAYSVIPSLES